jgi:hypothetical protein
MQEASIMADTTGFMNTWTQITANVKIHVIINDYTSAAFIYAEAGGVYEFMVPLEWVNSATGQAGGLAFIDSKPATRNLILKSGLRSLAVNTWYSQTCWVTGGVASRYENVRDRFNIIPNHILDYKPEVWAKPEGASFVGDTPVNAASAVGNYCFGIDSYGVWYAWDMTSDDPEPIGSGTIQLSGVEADFPSDLTAQGHWAFNREGTRACTTVWVSQFRKYQPNNESVGIPAGWMTSYVVEVEFLMGVGGFGGVVITQQYETPGFCFAADYDWTTIDNEIITAQLEGADYSTILLPEFAPATHYAVGQGFKVTDFASNRPPRLYWVEHDFAAGTGVSGSTPPTHSQGAATSGDLRIRAGIGELDTNRPDIEFVSGVPTDTWLYIRRLDDSIIFSKELWHYKVYGTGWQGSTTAYDSIRGDEAGFNSRLSGLDLRVRGWSFYSTGIELGNPDNAVFASLYGEEFTAASPLPSGAGTADLPFNNYWYPTLLRNVDLKRVQQTFACIPYLQEGVDDFSIRDAAFYAPNYAFDVDPSLAIDKAFKLSSTPEEQDFVDPTTGVAEIDGYHRGVYEATETDAPLANRYFISGGWAKKKDRE